VGVGDGDGDGALGLISPAPLLVFVLLFVLLLEKGTLMGDAPDADAHVVTLTAAQWVLLTDAKAKLDPTGAMSDAGAVELLCRRLLERKD